MKTDCLLLPARDVSVFVPHNQRVWRLAAIEGKKERNEMGQPGESTQVFNKCTC